MNLKDIEREIFLELSQEHDGEIPENWQPSKNKGQAAEIIKKMFLLDFGLSIELYAIAGPKIAIFISPQGKIFSAKMDTAEEAIVLAAAKALDLFE